MPLLTCQTDHASNHPPDHEERSVAPAAVLQPDLERYLERFLEVFSRLKTVARAGQ